MASRTLSVKFSTEGFNEAIASMNRVGASFENALQQAQNSVRQAQQSVKAAAGSPLIPENPRAAQQAGKDLEAAVKQVNTVVNNAFRELGVKTTQSIENQKQAAISAFNAIRASGVASAQDVANAQAQLTKKLAELDRQLDQTGESANDAAKEVNALALAGQKAGEGYSIFKNVLANLATSAIQNMAASLQQLAGNVISVGAQTEKTAIAFETFLGSAEEAKRVMEEVRNFAATTPFELPEVTDAAKQLLAVKTPVDQLIPTIKMLGEIAAGSDKPLGQLLFVYKQIKNQGRAYAEDINQLTNAGLSMADFAKALGIAETQVKELASKGKIGFAEVDKVIKSMTSEGGRFFGLMDKLGSTTAVKLSNLNDAFTKIYNSIYAGISPALSAVLDIIVQTLDPLGNNQEIWKDLNAQAQEFKTYISQNPGIAEALNKALTTGVKTALQSVTELAKGLLKYLQENPRAIQDAVEAMEGFIEVIGLATKAIIWLGKEINKSMEGWEWMLSPEKRIAKQIGESMGEDQAKAYMAAFETEVKAWEARGMPMWFPGNRQKVAETVAQQFMAQGGVASATPGEMAMRSTGYAGQQRLTGPIAYVGSTGVGNGPHLDLRGFTGDDRKTRLSPGRLKEIARYFEAGGKPLTSYPITSGYGPRNTGIPGASRYHPALDYGVPAGTPLVFNEKVTSVKAKPNQGGAGNVLEITLPTGEIVQLLHLEKFGQAIGKAATAATPAPSGGKTPFFDEVVKAAIAEGVDPYLYLGLVKKESGFRQTKNGRTLTSPVGALGLSQIKPSTARELGVDPNDPIQNLRGGARYLSQQLKRFNGNEQLALAAYNAGPGNVQRFGDIPPFKETQEYVKLVTQYSKEFQEQYKELADSAKIGADFRDSNSQAMQEAFNRASGERQQIQKQQLDRLKFQLDLDKKTGKLTEGQVLYQQARIRLQELTFAEENLLAQQADKIRRQKAGERVTDSRNIALELRAIREERRQVQTMFGVDRTLLERQQPGAQFVDSSVRLPRFGSAPTPIKPETIFGNLFKPSATLEGISKQASTILILDPLKEILTSAIVEASNNLIASTSPSSKDFPGNLSYQIGEGALPRFAGTGPAQFGGDFALSLADQQKNVSLEIEDVNRRITLAQLEQNAEEEKKLQILREQLALRQAILELQQREDLTPEERDRAIQQETAISNARVRSLEQVGSLSKQLEDIGRGALATFFENVLSGTQSLSDAFSNMAKSILQTVSQLAAQLATVELFKMLGLSTEGLSGANKGGGGGFLGMLGGLFGGLFGFASGGYTGPGSPSQPAGIVHRGEFVLNAAATRNLGPALLASVNSTGRLPVLTIPGESFSASPSQSGMQVTIQNVYNNPEDRFRRSEKTMAREQAEMIRRTIR